MAITAAAYTPTYSQVGAALAKEGRHSYELATQWTDADRFIGSSLNSIVSSEKTTSDEKAIAAMGFAMGNVSGMQWENSARARYAAAGAIAAAIPGSLGAVMGHVINEAYGAARRWDDADHITQAGLRAVQTNPNTTELDKDLAALGLTMGSHSGMQWENSARARHEVAEALVNLPAGGAGTVLAVVSQKAYGAANRWDDADRIAGDGLRAVLENSHSTDVQKALAKSSLEQTSVGGITWQDSARARSSALTQIAREN